MSADLWNRTGFDAAMHRTGAVRAKTYVQLFAAARILAMNRIARGDRLAIVTNGHGPGTLARVGAEFKVRAPQLPKRKFRHGINPSACFTTG